VNEIHSWCLHRHIIRNATYIWKTLNYFCKNSFSILFLVTEHYILVIKLEYFIFILYIMLIGGTYIFPNKNQNIFCTLAVVTTHGKSPRCAAIIILKLLMIELSFCNLPFSANMPINKIYFIFKYLQIIYNLHIVLIYNTLQY